MKKLKAIIWAIKIALSSPFQKKVDESQAEKILEDLGYKGQYRKPFINAIAYEFSPTDGSIREVIMIDGRAFMTPNTILIWASNLKNAEKKAMKI